MLGVKKDMNKLYDKYDVVIIGAGVGGLVCGCYLAKGGLKVLIVEQQPKVGGYCTSFIRNGMKFDSTVHSLCSLRRGGRLRKISDELNLSKYVNFARIDPSDIVITPDNKIVFRNEISLTIEELKKKFNNQKQNIDVFFNFIANANFATTYLRFKDKTFSDMLNDFFTDEKIKMVLSVLSWNMWISPSRLSALTAVFFFREFILDGGYYPTNGMQGFSDALAKVYTENGGKMLLSNLVGKVIVNNKKAEGVILNDNTRIESDFVISNADCKQTFFKLIGQEEVSKKFKTRLESLTMSKSAFIIYAILSKNIRSSIEKSSALWYCPSYKIEEDNFLSEKKGKEFHKGLFCFFPSIFDKNKPNDKESVVILTGAEYNDEKYWNKNKDRFADQMIKSAAHLIPNLESLIKYKEIATPHTLNRFTLNSEGAVHGWESTVPQLRDTLVTCETHIKDLYLVGHWVMQQIGQSGILTSANTGRIVAKKVLKNIKNKESI